MHSDQYIPDKMAHDKIARFFITENEAPLSPARILGSARMQSKL
jgi:hypothetical protein